MSITRDDAVEIVRQSLYEMGAEINEYGSALPGHADKKRTELIVTVEEEFDEGWLFAYNSLAFVQDADSSAMLLGNWPIFITRKDGTICSTADPEYRHYLNQPSK